MRYILLILIFISCNPVKQVLRDQEKLEQVAKVVVAGGWCSNDTTFITKSDTLLVVDTLVEVHTDIEIRNINDSVFVTKWKTKNITKTLTIRDTLKSYIVDNARIKLLQADSSRLAYDLNTWEGKAKRRQLWIFLLIGLIGLYFYLKSKIW